MFIPTEVGIWVDVNNIYGTLSDQELGCEPTRFCEGVNIEEKSREHETANIVLEFQSSHFAVRNFGKYSTYPEISTDILNPEASL